MTTTLQPRPHLTPHIDDLSDDDLADRCLYDSSAYAQPIFSMKDDIYLKDNSDCACSMCTLDTEFFFYQQAIDIKSDNKYFFEPVCVDSMQDVV